MQGNGRPSGFTVDFSFKRFHHLLHLPSCGVLWGVLSKYGGDRDRGSHRPLPALLHASLTLSPLPTLLLA